MKQGLIVAGGQVSLQQLRQEMESRPDLVIAADAGGKYLLELGLIPHWLVGDFDSLAAEGVEWFERSGVLVRRFRTQKDQTDLELALDLAIEAEITHLRILGGLGGRMDHTMANIGILQSAWEEGIIACLATPDQELRVTGDKLSLTARKGWAVSLIPLTPVVQGVVTTGLAYSLQGEDLFFTHSRGVHNQFVAAEAAVEIAAGRLLVVEFCEDGVQSFL